MAASFHKIKTNFKFIQLVEDFLKNNGGRRSGIDRRQFSYDYHIPERRSDNERRSRLDRRLKPRTSK